MTQEEIKAFTGNETGRLKGYVTSIEKNKFYARFDRPNMASIELEQKKKKLNLEQKKILQLGAIIVLDFNDGKLYFMKGLTELI